MLLKVHFFLKMSMGNKDIFCEILLEKQHQGKLKFICGICHHSISKGNIYRWIYNITLRGLDSPRYFKTILVSLRRRAKKKPNLKDKIFDFFLIK